MRQSRNSEGINTDNSRLGAPSYPWGTWKTHFKNVTSGGPYYPWGTWKQHLASANEGAPSYPWGTWKQETRGDVGAPSYPWGTWKQGTRSQMSGPYYPWGTWKTSIANSNTKSFSGDMPPHYNWRHRTRVAQGDMPPHYNWRHRTKGTIAARNQSAIGDMPPHYNWRHRTKGTIAVRNQAADPWNITKEDWGMNFNAAGSEDPRTIQFKVGSMSAPSDRPAPRNMVVTSGGGGIPFLGYPAGRTAGPELTSEMYPGARRGPGGNGPGGTVPPNRPQFRTSRPPIGGPIFVGFQDGGWRNASGLSQCSLDSKYGKPFGG